MNGITERTVGRGTFETWPTGATRQIEVLETKITESARHFGELAVFLQEMQASLEPADPMTRRINEQLTFIRNWNKHLLG